jgi:protocatechuate 3,4-dioxygenase beta subunit
MSNSRRNFCKNSVFIGLGLSFFPSLTYAKIPETISKKALILTRNAQKVLKVNGQIRYEDLSPVKNATIEIWHNNSESNPSKFDYEGKLMTDSEGNYSFETDFPEKHFEEKHLRTRRIYFKIKNQNGEEVLTKLHFGFDGKAFVDHVHVNNVPKKFKIVLPKTKFEENLFTIQFDIYLNAKVATNFA